MGGPQPRYLGCLILCHILLGTGILGIGGRPNVASVPPSCAGACLAGLDHGDSERRRPVGLFEKMPGDAGARDARADNDDVGFGGQPSGLMICHAI